MKTTRTELLGRHKRATAQALELMSAKNQDYGERADALANFRADGMRGIVVRLGDKVARLRTASKRPLAVKSESVEDTCLDVINYAVLMLVAWEERERRAGSRLILSDEAPPGSPALLDCVFPPVVTRRRKR